MLNMISLLGKVTYLISTTKIYLWKIFNLGKKSLCNFLVILTLLSWNNSSYSSLMHVFTNFQSNRDIAEISSTTSEDRRGVSNPVDIRKAKYDSPPWWRLVLSPDTASPVASTASSLSSHRIRSNGGSHEGEGPRTASFQAVGSSIVAGCRVIREVAT